MKQKKVLLWLECGLTSNVQFPVAWVIAVARSWEELNVLPEPEYKFEKQTVIVISAFVA
jgi:hypothetical protein